MCSEKARKGLIAAFLNLDPKDIQETVLMNTSLRKENENEKLGILDVRVRMHDNTQSWGMGKKRKMIYCNGRNF